MWQPIATAPKRGRYLIRFKNGDIWGVVWDSACGDWYVQGLASSGEAMTQHRRRHNEPTHWAPMPAEKA